MSQMTLSDLCCLMLIAVFSCWALYRFTGFSVPSRSGENLLSHFKFNSTSYRAETATRIAKLPLELREMIYYHAFNNTTDGTGSPSSHANAGPKEITMVHDSGMLQSDMPMYRRFTDTMQFLVAPHPVLLDDMHSYLRNTYFVCDGRQIRFGLDPWCRALNTYRLIRRVRVRGLTGFVRGVADFIRKLPSLEEVEVVVSCSEIGLFPNSCDSSTDFFQRCGENGEDLMMALFAHKSIRVVRLTTTDMHIYEAFPPHNFTSGIRRHKIVMHQLRDGFTAANRSSPDSSIRVELHGSLHLTISEMDHGQRQSPSFVCCVQHHSS